MGWIRQRSDTAASQRIIERQGGTDAPVPSVSRGSPWVGRGPLVCRRRLSRCASQCVLTRREKMREGLGRDDDGCRVGKGGSA